MIYPTHNAPIRLGDQLLIFYTGGGSRIDRNHGIPMSIGLATIGRDRFAGLASWRGGRRVGGQLLTLDRPHGIAAGRDQGRLSLLDCRHGLSEIVVGKSELMIAD